MENYDFNVIIFGNKYLKRKTIMQHNELTSYKWFLIKSQLNGVVSVIALLIWLVNGFSHTVTYTLVIGLAVIAIFSYLAMIGSDVAKSENLNKISAFFINIWFPCLLAFLLLGLDMSENIKKWLLGIFIPLSILLAFRAYSTLKRV